MADNNKPLTEEEIITWSRESYQKATAYLAEKGIVTETVSMEHSRYLAPLVAIWKVKTPENKWFWVVSGDLPSDYIADSAAANAREAMKRFSYKWQMDSETLLNADPESKDNIRFTQMLKNRAEGLYDISEQDDLWPTA